MDLQIRCPRCGHTEDDPLEVFDAGGVEDIRCASCGQAFHFAIMGCDGCGDEAVFAWRLRPDDSTFDRLTCERCHCSYRPDDTPPHTAPDAPHAVA